MSKEFFMINKPKPMRRSISQLSMNKPQYYNKPEDKNSPIIRNTSSKFLFNGNDLSKFYKNNKNIFNNNKILSRNRNNRLFKPGFDLNSLNMISNRSLKNIEKNSSIYNVVKNRSYFRKKNTKKDEVNELSFLPKIKPRKIIIDYYAGFNELHVHDLNQKYNSSTYKKFGHNGPYMGENYNPENYFKQPKNRFSTNYYGALFQN